MKKKFIVLFHLVGWDCLSLGFHICFGKPNIEIHLPFSFIRIGWERDYGQPRIEYSSYAKIEENNKKIFRKIKSTCLKTNTSKA